MGGYAPFSPQSFSQIVSARKPFGINTDIFNNKSSYPEYRLNDKPYENSVLLWGVYGGFVAIFIPPKLNYVTYISTTLLNIIVFN